MATYRELIGKKIKNVSSDPSSGTDGEMWYNSTTGTLRAPTIVEAFVSQTNMPTKTAYNTSFGQAVPTTVSLKFSGNSFINLLIKKITIAIDPRKTISCP